MIYVMPFKRLIGMYHLYDVQHCYFMYIPFSLVDIIVWSRTDTLITIFVDILHYITL